MSEPITDMLATAIVQFEVTASTGDEAVTSARSIFQDAMEESDLIGGGGLGPLKALHAESDGRMTYLASAVALFRILVPHGDDPMRTASDRLDVEIDDSPILSSGAVCTVEDD